MLHVRVEIAFLKLPLPSLTHPHYDEFISIAKREKLSIIRPSIVIAREQFSQFYRCDCDCDRSALLEEIINFLQGFHSFVSSIGCWDEWLVKSHEIPSVWWHIFWWNPLEIILKSKFKTILNFNFWPKFKKFSRLKTLT